MLKKEEGDKKVIKKKDPSSEDLQKLKIHVSGCNNEKCFKIWGGKWGFFIGGKLGSTHFDLTNCPEGKKLNEALGWDYNNPSK